MHGFCNELNALHGIIILMRALMSRCVDAVNICIHIIIAAFKFMWGTAPAPLATHRYPHTMCTPAGSRGHMLYLRKHMSDAIMHMTHLRLTS